jgi:hypothetical protein
MELATQLPLGQVAQEELEVVRLQAETIQLL